LFICAISSAG